MIRDLLHKIIQRCVAEQWGKKIASSLVFVVDPPENPDHGDYATNVALVAAKLLKKKPMEVAEVIAVALASKNKNKIIGAAVAVAPGFVNLTLSDEFIEQHFQEILKLLKRGQDWSKSEQGSGKTVMVEYFQLNIAKRPHIGHIRSAIIGDALKRIFLSQGYTAVSDTHVGDWGTQFGILLLGYKEAGINLHKQKMVKVMRDPFSILEEIYLAENARIESDPARRELAKQEFAKLEKGDSENRALWQWLVDVSMEKLKISGKWLNLLPFDEHRGESFYEDKMMPIAEDAFAKGIAEKKDNAVIVDLTAEGLDEAVLIKSDGASTYLLRDLATIKYRKETWNFWKNLYVVDVRQSHHFKQLFRVAELLGFEGVGESEHVSYGFMKLPEGNAISTRGGNVISLDIVLAEAATRARKIIAEKNPDLKNADDIARMVGLGALKYFDLSHNRESDIVFTWESALSFEGNTGPYLQYTYARLKSILRKIGSAQPMLSDRTGNNKAMFDSLERKLALTILRMPEAIDDTLAIFSPHILASYLYELAQAANEFYHSHPVAQEDNEQKKQVRVALVSVMSETIKQGLYLLGIETPEEM